MFYYLVLYQDCYHSNMTALCKWIKGKGFMNTHAHTHTHTPTVIHSKSNADLPGPYSSSVAAQIPLKHLLTYAQTHQGLYTSMYPSLLKIIATHFPQLCIVCEILRERKDELGEWAGLGGGRSSYIKLCFYGTVKNAFQPVVKISKDIVNPEYARKSKYCTFRSQFLISTFH